MARGHAQSVAFTALILLAISVRFATAATPVREHLKKIGANKFLALVETLKLNPEVKATGTFLVPSDAALDAFLKQMGLTEKDLLADPELVDLVLSYHFMPLYVFKDLQKQVPANAVKGTKARTGDVNYIWRVYRDPKDNRVWVQDVQNNNVTLGKPTLIGNLSIVPIDKVLMSGGYFKDVKSALGYYPQWSSALEFVKAHGSGLNLAEKASLFVPNNDAFKKHEKAVKALSAAAAQDTLRNHLVKPSVEFTGTKAKATDLTTQANKKLKISNKPKTFVDPWTNTSVTYELVELAPGGGEPAEVQIYNIYAGKNIIHGVDNLLLPGAAAAAAKPVAASRTGRRLHQQLTAAAAAAATPTTRHLRRSLLQHWVGTKIPAFNPATLGYYQGYPNIFRASDSASALWAAEQGSASNYGAGWDPYMAPQVGCFNCYM